MIIKSDKPPIETGKWAGYIGSPGFLCPLCDEQVQPGYDEASGGEIYGDGTYSCYKCGYFYERPM